MDRLWQDLKFGIRILFKNPVATLVALFSLALGIAANTAIFSMLNTMMLQPLPVKEPDQLVGLYRKIPQDASFNRFSYPNYLDVRDQNSSFSGVASYYFTPMNISGNNSTERVSGKLVSANYFSVLGVDIVQGRAFLAAEDEKPGQTPVAIISDSLWQRRFAADPNLINQQITINGQSFTVVGIAPRSFQGTELGMAPDVYVPMMMQAQILPNRDWLAPRPIGWLRVMARLKPGVSIEQAQAEMTTLGSQLKAQYPKENNAFGIAVVGDFTIHPQFRSVARNFMLILMAIVGLVLLIACANIANLMLARASERRREIGIRIALGAGRARLIVQLLTESLTLSLIGGAIGLLFTPWLIDGITLLQQETRPLPTQIVFSIDYRVMIFTLVISVLCGIIFGLAPALQSTQVDVVKILKDDASSRLFSRSRLRSLFVVAQVAFSLILLIVSGLFLRSLQNAQQIDIGFNSKNIVMASIDIGLQGYKPEQGVNFYQQLEQRLLSLPGVKAVGFSDIVPLGMGSDQDTTVQIEGYTPPEGLDGVVINYGVVSDHYLETLGIALTSGRNFSTQDTEKTTPVMMINETMARRFWPKQSAIGQQVKMGETNLMVVGIVRDAKYVTLGEDPRPYIYLPMSQNYLSSATLSVRTEANPEQLLTVVPETVRALDKDLPVFNTITIEQHLRSGVLLVPRFAAAVLSGFSLMAMLLSALGLYGVMAYAVTRRTHEIGIRIALGAQPRDVLKLILRHGLGLTVIGIVLGMLTAAAVTRLLDSVLYSVSAFDPLTFVSTAGLMLVIALIASLLPAWKAVKIDPMVALRYE